LQMDNFKSDLNLLTENVQTAVQRLQTISKLKTEEAVDLDLLRNTAMLIDSIAGLTEMVEKNALKVDALENLFINFSTAAIRSSSFHTHPEHSTPDEQMVLMQQLVLSLAHSGRYSLRNAEEVSVLMDFIKCMSWHEGASGVHANSISSKGGSWKHDWHSYDGRELGLPSAKSFSVRLSPETVEEAVGVKHFRMDADITRQEELRVSFVIPDDFD